jgi:uncharacterized protein YbjQ (UPF0145 family)
MTVSLSRKPVARCLLAAALLAAVGSAAGGSRTRRGDVEICQDALRKALADLQAKARARGASAAVGIIGNYHGIAYNSSTQYECHVGATRAVVDLRAQLAR